MVPTVRFALCWVLAVLTASFVNTQVYTDDWVIEVSEDMSVDEIETLAKSHGFVNMGPGRRPERHEVPLIRGAKERVSLQLCLLELPGLSGLLSCDNE
ncbi:unnamed protein product [Notodromas monacha]|uniref:Uncharacterized protein n=1 Tax=Notodromas monacha TaxID=399045 RepID=A0A7R9G952_9CRUS|nr:unnamed protein product [Notodromas monacha]CAG0912484.1 unnamed protein product [Notodromas monacha]